MEYQSFEDVFPIENSDINCYVSLPKGACTESFATWLYMTSESYNHKTRRANDNE